MVMAHVRSRKMGTYPGSSGANSCVSNYSNSTNSKTVGSGIHRRPSENILMNMMEGGSGSGSSAAASASSSVPGGAGSLSTGPGPAGGPPDAPEDGVLSFKPPNRKAVLVKNERPISNESIITDTGDVFSINAGCSKDSSSGTSIIDDEEDDEDGSSIVNGGALTKELFSASNSSQGAAAASTRKNGGSHLNNKDELDAVSLSHLTDTSLSDADLSVSTVKVTSTPKAMNTKYTFNNSDSHVTGNSNSNASSKSGSTSSGAGFDSSGISMGMNMNTAGSSSGPGGAKLLTRSKTASAMKPSTNSAMAPSSVSSTSVHSASHHGHHPLSVSQHSKSVPVLPTDLHNTKKPLTPSQRYRLRREQNKIHLQHSIKQKELFYDEDAKLSANELLDESLVATIPMASHSSAFLTQRKQKRSSASGSSATSSSSSKGGAGGCGSGSGKIIDTHDMPPSPIPGVQRMSDLEYFQQVGRNLSVVYQKSEYEITKSRLLERTQSAELLPFDFKNASEEGMEDLKLVSDDKVSMVTSTRPCWLPPKGQEERKSHEREVRKTLSMASIEKLESSHRREEQEVKDEINRQKVVLLIDRGLNRKSSLPDLRRIAWETGFSSCKRSLIYNTVLNTEHNVISNKYMDKLEELDEIIKCKMTPFPSTQMAEINKLADDMHIGVTPSLRPHLVKLLQWKSISKYGIQTGDNYLMYHLLLEGFEVEEIWKLANLLQLTCFNSTTRDKYDNRIMNKDGVVGRYMRKDAAFAEEFNSRYLNYMTFWNCLARVDHELFMWILDIIVAENAKVSRYDANNKQMQALDWDAFKEKHVTVNYKILCSLTLNVLLRYHFGWNNLLHLDELSSSFRLIQAIDEYQPIREQNALFVRKWNHYYAKF